MFIFLLRSSLYSPWALQSKFREVCGPKRVYAFVMGLIQIDYHVGWSLLLGFFEAWQQLLIWMISGQPMRDLVDGMVRRWLFLIDLGEHLFPSDMEVLTHLLYPIGRSWYVGSWQWGHDPWGVPGTFQYLGFNEGHALFFLISFFFFSQHSKIVYNISLLNV